MRVHHQLKSFSSILAQYDGSLPLHRFLIGYYKQNRQMGSTDRRWANRYIYAYYRLGGALAQEEVAIRLAIGDFLSNQTPSLIVAEYLPALVDLQGLTLDEKLNAIKAAFPSFNVEDVFPFREKLSSLVNKDQFYKSYFVQPDVFIRVSSTDQAPILKILAAAGIAHQAIGSHTISVPNGTKLEQYLPDNNAYYIQDISSQQVADYFKPKPFEYWWDCCAASGGKSLLIHKLEPSVKLLVSDVRASSLTNLRERFERAGIKSFQQKVLDLRYSPKAELHAFEFDGILLDAPCTGSGTWGRTPEMLQFFEVEKLKFYVKLQREIATQVVPFLKTGQPLIYMTCSVFEAENEGNVAYLEANLPIKLESMELIQKQSEKGDSLFVARFIKI